MRAKNSATVTVVFEPDRFAERAGPRSSLLLLGYSHLSGSLTSQIEADRFVERALTFTQANSHPGQNFSATTDFFTALHLVSSAPPHHAQHIFSEQLPTTVNNTYCVVDRFAVWPVCVKWNNKCGKAGGTGGRRLLKSAIMLSLGDGNCILFGNAFKSMLAIPICVRIVRLSYR